MRHLYTSSATLWFQERRETPCTVRVLPIDLIPAARHEVTRTDNVVTQLLLAENQDLIVRRKLHSSSTHITTFFTINEEENWGIDAYTDDTNPSAHFDNGTA